MAKKLYEESDIQDIANAIRAKNGSSDTYTISEMSTAIENIPSGGGDIYKYHWSNDGKICVREGLGEYIWFFVGYTKETIYDVEPPEELAEYFPAYCGGDDSRSVIYGEAYATASSTTSDRYIGLYNNKIRTWNSDLSQLMSGTFYGVLYVTPNTDASTSPQRNEYTSPTDVPISDITLIEKTITENGTYSAEDDGYIGYSSVVVDLAQPIVITNLWDIYSEGSMRASFDDSQATVTWTGASSIGFAMASNIPVNGKSKVRFKGNIGTSYNYNNHSMNSNWDVYLFLTKSKITSKMIPANLINNADAYYLYRQLDTKETKDYSFDIELDIDDISGDIWLYFNADGVNVTFEVEIV